jgi:hypothetical protein
MDDVVVKEFSAALAQPDAVVTDAETLTSKGHDYWGFGFIGGRGAFGAITTAIFEITVSEKGV